MLKSVIVAVIAINVAVACGDSQIESVSRESPVLTETVSSLEVNPTTSSIVADLAPAPSMSVIIRSPGGPDGMLKEAIAVDLMDDQKWRENRCMTVPNAGAIPIPVYFPKFEVEPIPVYFPEPEACLIPPARKVDDGLFRMPLEPMGVVVLSDK